MKELLTMLAQSLVDYPDQVSVNEIIENNDVIILELSVSKQDMGKVIGKHGKIAKALRVVMKACALKHDKRVVVEIV